MLRLDIARRVQSPIDLSVDQVLLLLGPALLEASPYEPRPVCQSVSQSVTKVLILPTIGFSNFLQQVRLG